MTTDVRRPDPASNPPRTNARNVPPVDAPRRASIPGERVPRAMVTTAALLAVGVLAGVVPASVSRAEPASARKIEDVVDILKRHADPTPADLARAGSGIERVLVDLLSTRKIDADLRFQAAKALGGYPSEKTRAVLASLLPNREEPAALRALAMRSLARVAGVKAVDDLLPWLKDADPVMRSGAARALGVAGEVRACARLSDTLEHEEVLEVRVAIEDGMKSCARRRNP